MGGKPKTQSTTRKGVDEKAVKEREESLLKGYKLTAEGKTTTYFHKELTAAEKKLLGDCSPQKIETSSSQMSPSKAMSGSSAWNQVL